MWDSAPRDMMVTSDLFAEELSPGHQPPGGPASPATQTVTDSKYATNAGAVTPGHMPHILLPEYLYSKISSSSYRGIPCLIN